MLTAYDLMLKKALASVQILWGNLLGSAGSTLTKNFSTVVDRLTADFQQLEEQHRRRPAPLPKALLQRRWRPIKSYGSTNQRLMTAQEAAAKSYLRSPTGRVRRPTTKVQEAQEVAAARGLMATAMVRERWKG
ncbi:hypothetical protein VE00_05077 [Pseudogymnoascus sp. WSF 3629]|nr:hypothetical protein VE00_05077 [Pseudogymnoascus sp. WSF 3629]